MAYESAPASVLSICILLAVTAAPTLAAGRPVQTTKPTPTTPETLHPGTSPVEGHVPNQGSACDPNGQP